MMRESFSTIIGESIKNGFERGIELYTESLNQEIYQDAVMEQIGSAEKLIANLVYEDAMTK